MPVPLSSILQVNLLLFLLISIFILGFSIVLRAFIEFWIRFISTCSICCLSASMMEPSMLFSFIDILFLENSLPKSVITSLVSCFISIFFLSGIGSSAKVRYAFTKLVRCCYLSLIIPSPMLSSSRVSWFSSSCSRVSFSSLDRLLMGVIVLSIS